MFLKIITHPVFMNLNFHMPMVVDLSHPLIMLTGENGSGKSTLLHSLYYSLKGEEVENFSYKLLQKPDRLGDVFLFRIGLYSLWSYPPIQPNHLIFVELHPSLF